MTKNEEPLNLSHAGPSEVKAVHVLLVYVNENFRNQLLMDVQLIKELSITKANKLFE